MSLIVYPLTSERWPDLEALFLARGCAMARSCWCMYYRESGHVAVPNGLTVAEHRRRQLAALAAGDPPPGLIGYRDGVPVGWVSLGPREAFPRLRRSPVAKPVDELPVWSIVCFVVPPAYRGQGVATGLLQGAIAFARGRDVVALEAYPVDKRVRSRDTSLWTGAMTMYAKAGFVEVVRRRPDRPVVRLMLKGSVGKA